MDALESSAASDKSPLDPKVLEEKLTELNKSIILNASKIEGMKQHESIENTGKSEFKAVTSELTNEKDGGNDQSKEAA